MSGTTSGDIHPSNGLPARELTAQSGPGDWLVGTFVMQALSDIPIDEYVLIYAAGGVYRNGDIRWAACRRRWCRHRHAAGRRRSSRGSSRDVSRHDGLVTRGGDKVEN